MGRRCVCSRAWPHTLCYWIRWRRLSPNSQQLLWSIWSEAIALPCLRRAHARRREIRHRSRAPREQHVRSRDRIPRPCTARPINIPLIRIQPTQEAHWASKQSTRCIQSLDRPRRPSSTGGLSISLAVLRVRIGIPNGRYQYPAADRGSTGSRNDDYGRRRSRTQDVHLRPHARQQDSHECGERDPSN